MESYIRHFCRKVEEVGLKYTIVGIARRTQLKRICKKYELDMWHESPYELRRYAQIVAKSVNRLGVQCVIDVGCGLGEILRHINVRKRYGYDTDSRVIEAAKSFSKDRKNIIYSVGDLRSVNVPDADCLVTIGWMHGAADKDLKELYGCVLEHNPKIRYVVVDVKLIKGQWKNFSCILPENFRCVSRQKYKAEKSEIWIEIYKCECCRDKT